MVGQHRATQCEAQDGQIVSQFQKALDIGRNLSENNVISIIWHDNVLKMKGGRMYEKILEFLVSQEDVKILPGKELIKILE